MSRNNDETSTTALLFSGRAHFTRAILLLTCALGLGAAAALLPAWWREAPDVDQTLQRVYQLAPEEGVFAYARISPDGRYLAYASEAAHNSGFGPAVHEVRIVELSTQRRVFTEPGVDAYWAPDGERVIFRSDLPGNGISIVRVSDGSTIRQVAPMNVGDYYSWSQVDGRDRILTILGRYFDLASDGRAHSAISTIPICDDVGGGNRPLLSKDGKQVTSFYNGQIIVRMLSDCTRTFFTRMTGAKADFSWDDRYIAFHAPKDDSDEGFDIWIVDTRRGLRRKAISLPGSAFFPSWTRDGRLCFRYEGSTYRGFLMASNVLEGPWIPLPETYTGVSSAVTWDDIFDGRRPTDHRFVLVLAWAPWSAHSIGALQGLQEAAREWSERKSPVAALIAVDQDPMPARVTLAPLERMTVSRDTMRLLGGYNQIPAAVLFEYGLVRGRRLGALSRQQLLDWIDSESAHP
jgi:hypothetical protein